MVSSSNDKEWIHFSMDAATIHHCLLLCSFICILLAGYAAQREQILPMDNFGNKSEWFVKPRSRFTNSTLYMSEAIAAQDKSHPLHKLHRKKLIRYNFGTTFRNYCHQKAVPQGWLPSLSRVLDMKIAPQALLRLAVLLGISIKFVLCLIRCASILKLLGGGRLVRLLCRLQPILELFSSAVLVTILSLHQEQDKSVKWLMPYNFPLFSMLYLLNGTLCITLDIIDPRKTFSSRFFNIKVSCLIVYSVCASTVHETLLKYTAEKPCHSYVPYRSAVAEYACVLSLLVFSMSQFDLNGLSGLRITVPSLPDDHIPTCSADYAPAVSYKCKTRVAPEDSATPSVL